MDAISYTAARANLAKTMEKVCNDHDLVIIPRKRESRGDAFLEDYQSMEETAYLLRSCCECKTLAGIHRRTRGRKRDGAKH